MSKQILVTGGVGYIGSHTVVELINAGCSVIVVDNLSNSSEVALERIEAITGTRPEFCKGDIRDSAFLERVFSQSDIDTVIHFAGLKAVGESVEKPLKYYDNNVNGTLVLTEAMAKAGVYNLVFSSSATVYGDPAELPIREDFSIGGTTNPYGTSKYMVERVLADLQQSDSRWQIAILRYFNPVGAHESGLIGEDPADIPNNLMPFISQVAVGMRDKLSVFGGDYETHDGTGVRDYIHVVDLALGHLKAVDKLSEDQGLVVYNLGTGKGYSVLDMVKAFEKGSKKPVPYKLVDRRPGDIAACFADPTKALDELGWKAEKGVEEMCADSWRWQSKNPNGYRG